MTTITIDVAIIGAGPGGLEAARHAAQAGLTTAIISNHPPGGRATWSALLPSKVWLHTAHQRLTAAVSDPLNVRELPQRIHQLSEEQSQHYRQMLDQQGIRWIAGTARLTEPGLIVVETEQSDSLTISARYTIVATGSLPRFTDTLRPNGERIIAPRLMTRLNQLPRSLIMVGGGVTGTEYATALAELGVKVTLVTDLSHLLPRLDSQLSEQVEAFLTEHKGITILRQQPVERVEQQGQQVTVYLTSGETLTADMAFIAIGRQADWQFATPELRTALANEHHMIGVSPASETVLPDIYAVGDVTGAPMMVNRARWQARSAIRHILGDPVERPAALIEAVFTHPPIASVRHPLRSIHQEPYQRIEREFRPLLKARLHHHSHGQLVVLVSQRDGHILGAHAFGPAAPEILAPIQLAINHEIPWSALQHVPFAHPTFSEILS